MNPISIILSGSLHLHRAEVIPELFHGPQAAHTPSNRDYMDHHYVEDLQPNAVVEAYL